MNIQSIKGLLCWWCPQAPKLVAILFCITGLALVFTTSPHTNLREPDEAATGHVELILIPISLDRNCIVGRKYSRFAPEKPSQ